ncbi:MAG: PilX N-terminal domain-containing pilus assembly protein [Desulfatiglandales bacterium]
MKSAYAKMKDEEGSVLVVALMLLVFLTFLGISASTTSEVEIQVAGNSKFHKTAFYAGEAARGYVPWHTDLYGPDNITLGQGLTFPSNADPTQTYALGSSQSFKGRVGYVGFSAPPRGSGYSAEKFKAHRYEMDCDGYGPSNAQSEIKAGFYRIGF